MRSCTMMSGGRTPSAASMPYTADGVRDRKSTRLNSSHTVISYAVFCLKKKSTRDGRDAQPGDRRADDAEQFVARGAGGPGQGQAEHENHGGEAAVDGARASPAYGQGVA